MAKATRVAPPIQSFRLAPWFRAELLSEACSRRTFARARFALVTDSILLDGVQIGRDCTVRKAILDKSVVVADGASIGVDKQRDLDRGFHVTDTGITVVGKGVLVTP